MAKLTNENISYKRLSYRFLHSNTASNKAKSALEKSWLSRLAEDHLQQSRQEQDSIIQWLLGEDREGWDRLTCEQQEIDKQNFNHRYQILKRYLNVTATQAYRKLIDRLSSVVVLQQDFKSWLRANPDGQRALLEVVQKVSENLLKSDRYLQRQMSWIARCTTDETLRNRLLLASLEEYCLRSVQNQPLFIDHLIAYVRCHQHQKSALLLLEPLMLDEVDQQTNVLEDVGSHPFSLIRVEIRYPLISA